MSSLVQTHSGSGPWYLADHAALDFINTVAQVDGQPHDFFQTDDDVKTWFTQAGLNGLSDSTEYESGALLQEARQLRETIRRLVLHKKNGERLHPEQLNRYLALANSYKKLVTDEQGSLRITRIYANQTPAQWLEPMADLAASLLAEKDFNLVRECEHPECTLWFFDRTKAHRRRWCSMALCGNRAKVARFRQQQK